jgi:hypothetical protein
MTERTTRIRLDSERESSGLLSLLASLPCVSQVVQATTLANVYVLRLDDPEGRFRAAAQAFGGWTS